MVPLEVETNTGGDEQGSHVDSMHHRKSNFLPLNERDVEEEDEEFEEVMGLLGGGNYSTRHPAHLTMEEETPIGRQNSLRAWIWWILTMGLVGAMTHFLGHRESQWEDEHGDERAPPVYDCPSRRDINQDTVSDSPMLVLGDSIDGSSSNKTWIQREIAPYILEDDTKAEGLLNRVSILDLASHSSGQNLFEILKELEQLQVENENPTQFWVYGNDRDPFQSSFEVFHKEDALDELPNIQLGIVCSAEDTPPRDISYLPRDTFDMVYTGRIPPLQDPLGYGGSFEELKYKYQSLCRPGGIEGDDKSNHNGIPSKELAQQAQEAWILGWIADMAQLARPGGLLVIDNLSIPYCESDQEFGGVSWEWLSRVTQENQEVWGVDPTSLHFGRDHDQDWRYSVVMRRQEKFKAKSGGK